MRKYLVLTAVLGIITIILGAFGSHALTSKLSVESLKSFEIAVQYQFFHVIVLLFVNTYSKFSDKTKKNASLLFLLGILFFSGSIYIITVGGIAAKTIWFITPLGGLLLIAGWSYLLITFLKNKF